VELARMLKAFSSETFFPSMGCVFIAEAELEFSNCI
jgi:hypothetical protein